MRSAFFCLLLLITSPALAAPLKIVASFSILGDMVRQVAGPEAEVTTLVGPNGDAHAYEPTPAAVRAIAAADIVFVNGLGFEGWLGRLIASSGYKGPVVAASDGIAPLALAGGADPHAWQSLENGRQYVAMIRDGLMEADAAHASVYEANAAAYLRKLAAIEGWVKSAIARVPQQKRKVITSHDAFRYFAQSYGVTMLAAQGVNTESEASAADLARLIDQIRHEKVTALFLENISNARLIGQLKSDGGAVIGGTLYSDALSDADGPAPTYIAMFTHNVRRLTEAMKKNPD